MKMEGGDLLKLTSSTKTTDTGGLTFGPAWLRQLSSGDTKVALPPSPGLAFQLAKHRYGREEMLAIYESLENKPFFSQAPVNLEKEFEDLFKKDLQRPVLMYPPTHEEQKFLSTCVNSQMVLNSYNKTQGQSSSGNSGSGENRSNNNNNINGSSGSSNGRSLRNNSESEIGVNRDRTNSLSMSRGGSNSMRGSRGGGSGSGHNGERVGGRGERQSSGGVGGIPGERGSIGERGGGGGGRGRGRGRGTDSQHPFKSIEEEGRGGSGEPSSKNGPLSRKEGSFTKSSYSRSHWDDRETIASGSHASTGGGNSGSGSGGGGNSINTNSSSSGGKKEYSRAMNEENWRNKAAANAAESESNNLKDVSNSEEGGVEQGGKFNENDGSSNSETNSKNSFSENSNSANNNSNSTSTTNNSRNWRNALDKPGINQQNSSSSNREWPSYKSKITNSNSANNPPSNNNSDSSKLKNSGNTQDIHKKSSDNRNPEWLDDDDEENIMTFDDSGKFISIKELPNKKAQLNQPETKSISANEANKNIISTSTESDNDNKQKSKEEPSSNNSKLLSQQSNPKEQSNKISNKEEKNSSQSQSNQLKQSLEQQQIVVASPTGSNVDDKDTDKTNITTDLNIGTNKSLGNKNESIINIQQQHLLQPKFQINEDTALKLSQLGLNDFTIKNLQNAPINEQLIIANALQNLTLNQNKNNENLIQQNINQMSTKNTDPKLGAVSLDHPDAENWFYLDPQNQIQGAFSSEQMAGWFTAGYFTLNLMVKRGCDDKFLPLGVVSSNWGRIPFTPGPQQPPLIQQQSQPQQPPIVKQVTPQQQTLSKEQIIQQMQLYQLMSQSQFFPQNFNLLRNELVHQINSNMNMSLLGNILQQLQQLQIQQKAAAASVNTLGQNTVLSIMHELRSQQENLINQFSLTTNASKLGNVVNDPTVVDPAILGASTVGPAPSVITNSNKSQSIWGDLPNRISPNNNLTPPSSISPMNNLISGQVNHLAAMMSGVDSVTAAAIIAQQLSANSGQNAQLQILNDSLIKDKIQALFEQTKKEEERKRKMEEEYQLKLKISEEEKRRALEEMRQKEEEQKRLMEEERVREEMRKELQKKKLEEIIKKQEEEKRKSDELKRMKEEEQKLKHAEKQKQQKQKEELKKLELQQQHQLMQQNEENEKKRQQEQVKQAELIEKQKLKLQQEQLNNLQLPAHANWANSNQNSSQQQQQQQALQLKSILEQQELELIQQRALLEQQKQAELQANQQNNPGGKWSNLFRGAPPPPSMTPFTSTSPPTNVSTSNASSSSNPISLASIQAEQTRLESNTTKQGTTMSQKISQTPPKLPSKTATAAEQQQKNSTTTWAAWGNSSAGSNASTKTVTNSSNEFSLSQSINGPTPSNVVNNKNSSVNSNANSNPGFWGDLNETKKTSSNGIKSQPSSNIKPSTKSNVKPNSKNQSFPELQNSSSNHSNYNNDANYHHIEKMSKSAKKIASVEESVQHAFLRNMTISEEFMKWCHDQLSYFNVDLHIPTFVNFLREIESCAEIEDYVINYLGDTQQAKDFAQQFYINRESQIIQQSNNNDDQRDNEDSNSQFQTKGDTQFSKQRQKKRSKGQRLDNQLLGFTVQPDPNLKNRGDIDPL